MAVQVDLGRGATPELLERPDLVNSIERWRPGRTGAAVVVELQPHALLVGRTRAPFPPA